MRCFPGQGDGDPTAWNLRLDVAAQSVRDSVDVAHGFVGVEFEKDFDEHFTSGPARTNAVQGFVVVKVRGQFPQDHDLIGFLQGPVEQVIE